jgi:hypothetical protein
MGERLCKWIMKDDKMILWGYIDEFTVKTRGDAGIFDVTEKNFHKCYPLNCVTAWELQRDYGVNKQKISRAVKAGKLNAFMVGIETCYLLKWYIERDMELEKFIAGCLGT